METYKNVMEMLVEEEVRRQLQAVSERLLPYMHVSELTAYALNHLPPLYATSQEGFKRQIVRGKAEFADRISQAVRWAIAAVQRDPIRASAPLHV